MHRTTAPASWATRTAAALAAAFVVMVSTTVPGVLAADPPSAPNLVELKVNDADLLSILFRFAGNAPPATYGVRLNIYVTDVLVRVGTSIPYAPATFNHAIKEWKTPVSSFGYGSTEDIRYCIGLKTFVGDGTNENSVFSAESSRQCVGTQRVLVPFPSTGPCPFAACDPRSTTDAVVDPVIVRVNDVLLQTPNISDLLEPAAPQPGAPPLAAPRLELGSNGEPVKALQRLLNVHDGDVFVDGDFGPQTEQAVREFQEDEKLVVDGIVGSRTWDALFVTIRRNDTGDAVRLLQDLLDDLNLDVDTNGRFDQKTEAAVRKFQGDKGLAVDGVVGPRTWTALVAGL
jgi:hypothetical protein